MATAYMTSALVEAPARSPLPFGLFSHLQFRDGSTDRWRLGAQWQSGTCAPANGIGYDGCEADEEVVGLPKTFGEGPGDASASPFTVYGHFECSPIGTTAEEAQQRANAHLMAREEQRVSQALWTGDLGNMPNFSGANGFDAPETITPLTIGLSDTGDLIGSAEDWMRAAYGSLGVLHMPAALAQSLIRHLEARNGRLFTRLGTPVVLHTAYSSDGTTDEGYTPSIIVTPAMFGYRGEIETSSARPYDLLNRETNDLVAIAERQYLIGFDNCGFGRLDI